MVNKRGLSPDEFYNLSSEELEALMIYDRFIEPSGLAVQTQMFANLCHLILVSSSNISEQGRKEARVSDWDIFGTFDNLTYSEKIQKQEEEEQQRKVRQVKQAFSELIKMEEKKGNKNG